MDRFREVCKICGIAGVGLLVTFLAVTQAQAATSVALAWDANTDADLAGYRIHYGTTSGNRTQVIDVGNVTSYTVTGLTAGTTYYFAVHAYDLAGNESLPSNEIAATPAALAPVLTLSGSDAPDPAAAGSNLTYTLTYGNTGTANATGVVLTDTVPANATFISATGGGTLSGGVVTWSLGTLAAAATGSVQMVVRVTSPLANGSTITNGSYSIDSVETAAVAGSALTTTVTSAPTLTLSGSDSPDPVAPGANLTYTLGYGNSGTANATGVVLTDTVPANTTFVSATGGGTLSGTIVSWSLGTLNAAATASVQMVVRVASPLANGSTITNGTYLIDSNETAAVAGAAVTTIVTSAPTLTLSGSDAPDPVAAGANLTYTLSYGNTGTTNATGVVLTDTMPANTSFVSATGGGTLSSGVVTWSLGTLAAAATGSVQMVVRVTSPLANGSTITNGSYSIDSVETAAVAGAAVTTTVTSAPALTLTGSDAPDPVAAGANLTYTLTYGNTGTANATGVVLTDTVPVNTTFISATGGGTLSGGVVTWSLGTLAAAATGSVQMVVRVTSPLANGSTITNGSYSIDSVETAAVAGAAVTTTVTSAPTLTLSGSDAPDPVAAGANLTYTLTYGNSGTANATGVVLTDTVPANTSFVSATGGGTLSSGVVTWSLGTLAAAATGSVQMVVRVASPLADGTTITNGATSIDSAETTAVAGSGITTTVTSAPALTLTGSDAPDPVAAGANLTYTLSYANAGSAGATGVVLTNTVPANTSFVSATAGGTLTGGVVTWSLGTLAAAATGSVQMVVRVASPLANGTTITNGTASIDSNETAALAGPVVTTTVTSLPTLSLSGSDAPDPVAPGANLTYTLSYANTGSGNATGVTLADSIPANSSFVSATPSAKLTGRVVTWTLGTLDAGAVGSVQLVVSVAGGLANGSTITNGSFSIDSNETAAVAGSAVTTTVSSPPILTLSASDSPDPVSAGANLTYTLSYGNSGTASATGVVLVDAVPANTSFVSATGGGTASGGLVSWNLGTLNAGASGSVQMVVRVTIPLTNGSTITNGTLSIDSNETAVVAGSAVTTTVLSGNQFALGKTASPGSVLPGANITYTLSCQNVLAADATGVVLADTVPANTTFVSATGGGALSGGVVSWSLGTLVGGASGSVQLVVRVTSPLPDGTLITNSGWTADSNESLPQAGPSATTTVTSSPTLTLSGSDAPDPVAAGANLTYTLNYGNTGTANATGVVLTDTVPANTTFVSATGGGTASGGVVTWSLGTLNAAAAGSVQMVVRVTSPLANGTTITNGTLSIDSVETTAVAGAAVTTTVTSSPTLTLSGSDAPDPVTAGANLTYTLSYGNTGTANATGLVLTDTVPANTTFVSATGGGTFSGGVVTWSPGTLNAGTSGSVQMVVRVTSPLANGTTITNGAYDIDSVETAAVAGGVVTTTVTSSPTLTLSGSDAPDPVTAGANLTYTLSFGNGGGADATGVVLTDTVPANTSFVSATGGGTFSGGVATWSLGTLSAGASGSVQMVVRVASPLANGTTITNGTYTIDSVETAAVAGGVVTTTVTSSPILTLGGSDAPDPVAAGANLTYTLTYGNSGTANATGVVLTDALPVNTSFVSATGGGTLSSGVVTWSLGTLSAGATGSLQMVVRVTSPLADGTTITNTAYTIDSVETAAVAGTAVTTTVTSLPILTLGGSDAPDPVTAGANLTYTLTYGNSGTANATGVVLTDALPVNTTFVSATGGGTLASGVVTWNLGTLNAGTSGSLQMVVRVTSPLANGTTITNATYTIDSVETAAVAGAAVTTTVTSLPILTLGGSDAPDPVTAGANLTYTLSYGNTGTANATGLVLTDTVPANTTFVSATGGGTLASGVVTWNLGTLNAGASGSVQMVVRVTSPLANGTTITNATYTIDSVETAAVAGAAVTTTVTSLPILTLGASDSPDPVTAGANLTYTLTYGNSGTANATGVVLADTLPVNTTFVSATGGGTLSGSVVTWNLGTLNAGATGSAQMVVHVTSPLANGTTITNATYTIDSVETAAVGGAAVTTTVTSLPVLTLGGSDAPDPVTAGANLTYTLTYGNSGTANATGVVLTDTVPVNTTFVSANGGGTLSGSVVTWSLGTLNVGATGSMQMVVRVASPLANNTTITNGTYTIDSVETAAVSGTALASKVSSAPRLGIAKAHSPSKGTPGGTLTYTTTYTNTGNADATGVLVTDRVPQNTVYMSSTGGGALSAGVVTWNVGLLAAGASGTVQMVVQIDADTVDGTTIVSDTYAINSNEVGPVAGAPDTVLVSIVAPPVITSVIEASTSSIYVLRSGTHVIHVAGSNLQNGAVANLSADISAGTTRLSGSIALDFTIQVASTATLGPRTLTLTNPDLGKAQFASALTVVRSPDLNGDCLVDGADLNLIARAWNTTSGQAAYNAAADLDGDNYVGPIDLTIFTEYFGHLLTGCP